MKRLFGREKPKIVKTPSTATEIGHEEYFNESHHYQHGQPTPDRMHSQDRVHALAHSSSDEHWDLVNSHDGHSPIPSSYIPRAASPFSGSVSVSSHKSNGDRDGNMLRKKSPHPPNPTAAVGILRALDPQHPQTTSPPKEPDREPLLDDSHSHRTSEKKERKGFWERAKEKEKEREKAREEKERAKEEERREKQGLRSKHIDKERKEEEAQAELTRMIGYLTATASEDWSLVLEVCERTSANETSARETVKALRREFKYAEPTAQLAAARLWAILLQNSSSIFMSQCTSRKFLETLEEVIQAPRTSPVVKERLLQVLAAAAYAGSSRHNRHEKDPFRTLWRRLKAPNQPDEGIPLDAEDAMLNPPAATVTPPDPPRTPSHRPQAKLKSTSQSRIIPPEEDMRRLFQECKFGHGNAALLADALVHARPEDLKTKTIIKEFYARCRASQELIYAQIPWASANAERSRQAGAVATPRRNRKDSLPDSPHPDTDETVEEQLLAALLSANEELAEALKVYEDLERLKVERDVEARSRKETRMNYRDRPRHHNENSQSSIVHGGHARSAPTPPSPSPSPSPSPPPSVTITPYTPSYTHPLPPIPPHSAHANHANAQQQLALLALQQQQQQNLAPPPPAPHGPRLPVPSHRSAGSRSPSPTDRSFVTGTPSIRTGDASSDWDRYGDRDRERDRYGDTQSYMQSAHTPRGKAYSSILEMEDDSDLGEEGEDEDFDRTPHQPSAKALGKRKIIEQEDTDSQFDPDDIFYEHNNDSRHSASFDDLDSEGEGLTRRAQVHYVYDAAAEKTRERIREGRLGLAATNANAAPTLVGGVH